MRNCLRMAFYAVAKGRQTGIFRSWAECENQTKGFGGAKFKKFKSQLEAQNFINGAPVTETLNLSRKKPRKINFSKKIDQILTKPKGSLEEILDAKFESFPEYPDEPTMSETTQSVPKELKASTKKSSSQKLSNVSMKSEHSKIPFKPPEPTVRKNYNGFLFNEGDDGFVHVYTDGSCERNGKKLAAAGFGVFFGENHELNASEPVTGRPTNNVGEIQAAIKAIEVAQINGIKRLNIFTDSQFTIKSVCFWMRGWKKKNWKKASGKPVANQKDFKRLDELIESGNMLIKWSYIPAHKGYVGNEMADQLAKAGASLYRTKEEITDEELTSDSSDN